MNEMPSTQDYDDECHSWDMNHSDDMHYDEGKDEDLIASYLDQRIEELVKSYLAKCSEELIDLAIKAYVLSESNRKREAKYNLIHCQKTPKKKSPRRM